jgi:aminoglycoside 6'-N-acetyltransferase
MPFPTYQFRAVTTADLPLLREWLWRRHVREWWGDPVSGLARIAEHIIDPAINPFMVECDDVPIGYIQVGTLTRRPVIPAAISRSERAASISSLVSRN